MNKEYLKNFYDENKESFLDNEQEINSLEDLVDYIEFTITSNIQYDFSLDIDLKQLFNQNTNTLDTKEEEIEYEKD